MTLQDSPFPFDRPHSPVQREPYPSGRLPYSPSDTPLYGLNRGQFSRKGREMGEAFVYLWYDAGWKQTGGERYYIGKHKGTLDSGYICSSKYMKPEWEERGCKQKGCRHLFGEEGHHGDFHRRVLAYGTEQEMIDFEIKLLVTRKDYFGSRYYNKIVMWAPPLSGDDKTSQQIGIQRARLEGKYKGRPASIPQSTKTLMVQHIEAGNSYRKTAEYFNVSSGTVQRAVALEKRKGIIKLKNAIRINRNQGAEVAKFYRRYTERKKLEGTLQFE